MFLLSSCEKICQSLPKTLVCLCSTLSVVFVLLRLGYIFVYVILAYPQITTYDR
jgi:hypothetical protein